ncbi:hypothetical protein [Hahella chejuensis]|nr:hypothetical protein [Hahella chejuensis]
MSTESKYSKIRREVVEMANELLPIHYKHSVSYGLIDMKALMEHRSWHGAPGRKVNWDWERGDYGYNHYLYQEPKRFEIAVWWRQMKLCGLSLGQPTWSGSRLRLDFIEATPLDNPIKGLTFSFIERAAELYAMRIDANEIRLMKPISAGVIDYYGKKGYAYNSRENYCYKVLR